VRVGTRVRVELHGRLVGGWVVADGVEPPPGVKLRPIAKVTGWGPSPELVALADWAAWRWVGRPAGFLGTASPPFAVRGLPPATALLPATGVPDALAEEALCVPGGRAVLRLPPAADRFAVILAAASRGPTLVVTASRADTATLAARLERNGRSVATVPRDWVTAAAGCGVVVGPRAAAWAPVPGLAAVVCLDAHDDVHQEERAPTWNAWVVAAERARRAAVPCVLVSPCPTLEVLDWGTLVSPSRSQERAGWPFVDVVDRRRDDPRTGLYSERLVTLIRSGGRVVCVLNRKGRAKLLACVACGELARCERCGASVEQTDDGGLRCRVCGASRPAVCAACGGQRLKTLRVGVSRAREELEALAGRPVGEVTGESDEVPDTPVLVGTEAVLHRVARPDAVAFLDFDQELLAPRYRAAEQALALLARAARLVGGRDGGGRVMVQTRLPRDDVLVAALHADPGRLSGPERERRRVLSMPPFTAMAVVSGEGATAFVEGVTGLDVLGPDPSGRWLLRGPDHQILCDALAGASRPPGRLRIEVDPVRA
jgi:primosomal protein N' (replication factor Y)